jgi:uncharacterized protein YndB with AHSA1/START domain
MAEFATSIDIAAPPDVVFSHLVVPEKMVAWMGERADLQPVPGGGFAVDVRGTPFRGQYIDVDPPRRVVISWGIAGNDAFPPGTSQVEFTLAPTATGTALRLVHSGLPDPFGATHGAGWTHYLGRLELVAAGVDAGVDTFTAPPRRSSS